MLGRGLLREIGRETGGGGGGVGGGGVRVKKKKKEKTVKESANRKW